MKTTLNAIRSHRPCAEGWTKLLRHLGKTQADDEPLSIVTVLKSNGLDDALWCLRAVTGHDREIRLYAVWCARQVRHLMTDPRSVAVLDVAEKFANGEATEAELKASWGAARDAARGAARIAAWDAAKTAAWGAAKTAAWGAAWDAAWDAARDTARIAAWDAAWDVEWDAARDAAGAAARFAAWDAARAAQEAILIEVCNSVSN